MWDSRCRREMEEYGQRSHLKHFSPWWVFLWTLRVQRSGKVFPHILQWIGSLLVWSLPTCSLRSVFREHVIGHSSHWNVIDYFQLKLIFKLHPSIPVCQILQTGPYLKKDGRKTGIFLTKIRALDGRKDGRRRAKLKFLFLKRARKFDSQLFSWLHWLGRASKLKIMRRNHLLKVHSLVATWFNLLNSSLTLWTCTKSQKDGQNYKNTGVRRAILPKCPSRRANPSIDGRLWHTAVAKRSQSEFAISVDANAKSQQKWTLKLAESWFGWLGGEGKHLLRVERRSEGGDKCKQGEWRKVSHPPTWQV